MAKLLKIVHENKADKGLRFLNYVIDLIFCYIIIILGFGLIGILLSLITDTDIEEFVYTLENINPLLDRIITLICYALLMFLIEYLTKGRSLGKYVTGTMAIKSDGNPMTLTDYFLRNISRAIPLDPLSFLGNNGWHDTTNDSRVVKKKAYYEAIDLQSDLDNFGKSV